MGKVGIMLLIALGIYVGVEVYNEGVDRAFGGFFAGLKEEVPAAFDPDPRSVTQRAADVLENAYDTGIERAERVSE